jgi:pyrimidine operon attenuation protein / uracil phosphoribosyltransferase
MSTLSLDAEHLYQQLVHGVDQLRAACTTAPTRLVGIASGGVWLADRLNKDLHLAQPHGVISSTLHRDDFGQRGLSGGKATQLPFEVNGAHIVLIDDVLYTGRTIRAVLNELFDYGRPASVQLAVLVDRGGRELPVEAQYAAARVSLPAHQKLSLSQTAQGRLSFAIHE